MKDARYLTTLLKTRRTTMKLLAPLLGQVSAHGLSGEALQLRRRSRRADRTAMQKKLTELEKLIVIEVDKLYLGER